MVKYIFKVVSINKKREHKYVDKESEIKIWARSYSTFYIKHIMRKFKKKKSLTDIVLDF